MVGIPVSRGCVACLKTTNINDVPYQYLVLMASYTSVQYTMIPTSLGCRYLRILTYPLLAPRMVGIHIPILRGVRSPTSPLY